ncbi:MAG: hypothetical protein K2Z81_25470 [Cyanobacteria bacterium]|nr:hypothetical protein [Cyanobacteriota bacterium]
MQAVLRCSKSEPFSFDDGQKYLWDNFDDVWVGRNHSAVVTAPPVVSEPPTKLSGVDRAWINYATIRDTLKERKNKASDLVKQLKKKGKTTKDKELVDAFYEFLAAEADLESLRNCMLLIVIAELQGSKGGV